jgi:hypothetical protein
MQPDPVSTWDEFTARKAARETGEDSEPIQPPSRQRPEARESLSILLMQAIHLAGARRGRIPRAERIREATLLEVLAKRCGGRGDVYPWTAQVTGWRKGCDRACPLPRGRPAPLGPGLFRQVVVWTLARPKTH